MQELVSTFAAPAFRRGAWAVATWLAGAALLALLDGTLDLANMALILVLVSTLAALWSSPSAAVAASVLGVLAFNYALVPPRGSFSVNLHQHALLLGTMLAVSALVAMLMARQLRMLGERLREADEPASLAATLLQTLQLASAAPATLLLQAAGTVELLQGEADADETAGLRLCLQQGAAMGPGTGRHEEQPAWYLPMRGRHLSHGAALLRVGPAGAAQEGVRRHAQALCDQMGLALERAAAVRQAAAAREAAQTQALRNTLLAAVAHDHRTPLATILGAASSLHDQADRLSPEQRKHLAATIVDEAGQLARLTENTLQLARLDTPGLALRLDWEAAEELIGTVLRRLRQRDPSRRLRTRVEPDLPLLRCDALLLVQLLDNLVDNALKYGGEAAPVEIVARRIGEQLVIAVRDRGPGVPAAQRERIFESFQRGEAPPGGEARRGAGVGLALCRAVARAHGGELRLRPRGHGGTAFELWLPLQAAPQLPGAGP